MSNGPLRVELDDGITINFAVGSRLPDDVYEFSYDGGATWQELATTRPQLNRRARRAAAAPARHAHVPPAVKVSL